MHKIEKGITLIALIITIIVMLILVAVTINVAMNGGIFGKATKAAKDTEVEADKEQLLSSVTYSYDYVTGKVDGEKLANDLGNKWQVTGEGPYTVTSPNKNIFTVATNGNITIAGTSENAGENNNSGEEENAPATYAKEEDLTLGTGVSLVAYENLTGDIKEAVDSGKVIAVLTETINSTPTIAVIPTGFTVSTTTGENTISGGLVVRDGSNNEFVWIPYPI